MRTLAAGLSRRRAAEHALPSLMRLTSSRRLGSSRSASKARLLRRSETSSSAHARRDDASAAVVARSIAGWDVFGGGALHPVSEHPEFGGEVFHENVDAHGEPTDEFRYYVGREVPPPRAGGAIARCGVRRTSRSARAGISASR